MGIDETLTAEIVRRILTVTKPDRIILFGSAATGQMNEDSDIDLLLLQPAPTYRVEDWVRIRRTLRGMGYPFDLFIMPTERFERTKNLGGGLAYPANKDGRVIYAAG